MINQLSFIRIARITKTQGLKGVVRVELLLEDDRILQPGRRVHVARNATEWQTEIEFFRMQHGHAVMKLRGIESISDAEKVIGAELSVPADEIVPLEVGSYYTFQLKGCKVFGADDQCLGTVIDVMDCGGSEVLKVEREGGRELLIPFAQSFLKKVDAAGQRIDVELPEGLLELN